MDKTFVSANVTGVKDSLNRELRTGVYRFVFSRVKNHALAEDLTQEILIKAARGRSSLRETGKLEAWIFRIARNRIHDYFRASRTGGETFDEQLHGRTESMGVSPVIEAEEAALRGSLREYIRGVVNELPPLYRDALMATEFEGLSQIAYAKRSGISIPAAKSSVQRGRREVRRVFEACCEIRADRYGNILEARPRRPEGKSASCPCDS